MNKFGEEIKHYGGLLISHLFNLLPIKNNKLFFYSYYGSQYGCNPKYISQYIVENYPKDRFDIVWCFNDVKSKKDIKGIRYVKNMSLKYFYELCTSKVIITNFRTTDLFIKRKNQYYIQTWHSSLRLKQIEKDAEDSLPKFYVEMAKKDSKKLDLLLSGCKFSTEIFRRAFWYEGDILECGTPRNDLFFHNPDEENQKIKEKLNLDQNKKIILYAPTFRKDNNLKIYNLDYDSILEKLNKKFDNDWIFLVKLHPHLINKSKEIIHGNNVIDVTKYDDIQELLNISDVLVSDYSSLMFDFALTKRPCFLYIPDLENYMKNDRGLYFNVKDLPFIKVRTNKEFIEKIESYNYSLYEEHLNKFFQEIGSFEQGGASKKVLKYIEKVCYRGGNNYEKIQGGIYNRGI